MERRIGLDIPRALAITLVLISHLVKQVEVLGFYGVELFFALSGFLIGGILYRNLLGSDAWTLDRVKNFWKRRWWRTLPNYYLFLLVALVFHFFHGGFPSLTGFLPFCAFLQNLAGATGFYGVSWSLCVEEWFYLLFPLVILACSSCGIARQTSFIVTSVLFLVASALIREILFSAHDPASVRLITYARLDAICYGVVAAFVVNRFAPSRQSRYLALIAGGMTVIGVIIFHVSAERGHQLSFYRMAFIAVPAGFALMLPYLETVSALPKLLGSLARPIRSLSLYSYSLYLSHIPVLFTVYYLFGSARDNAVGNALSKIVALAVTLVISRFLFLHFESKLTAFRPDGSLHGKGAQAVHVGPSLTRSCLQ